MTRKLQTAAATLTLLAGLCAGMAQAQDNAPIAIAIDAGKVTAHVSPLLYGLMTEEINFSYEGGIYGELIRNRTFKADPKAAAFWTPVGNAAIALDSAVPLNDALNVSLKLDASGASSANPQGIANGGYFGVPVRPNTTYRVSFYARNDGKPVPVTVAIKSNDGKTVFASAQVVGVGGAWKQYKAVLKTGKVPLSKANQFTLTTAAPATLWLQQVSLFPPTVNNRPNGTRPDIMKMLADMNPKFLRLPGGNYLEGSSVAERFDWKKTLGDTAQRPGHPSPWNYWSTDGLGMLEYLEWCEDLHMEPVLAVYAGYSLRNSRVPMDQLQPYVQDALDEIEYVTGDVNTVWGARRAKDGHPKPFALHYVEVGNEDFADREYTYDKRFSLFFDAIKAKYPKLQVISTIANDRPDVHLVTSRVPDLVDEHLYPASEGAMEVRAHEFDTMPRTGSKIFVGEWATRVGSPTPNMAAALGDAAWMTGMERNSDLVLIESYAPLFVNVSDTTHGRADGGSMQWPSDLIGYDALTSYGSPSYYAQAMFSQHHGDVVLAASDSGIPTWTWQPPAPRPPRTAPGAPPAPPAPPAALPPTQQVPTLFYDVTRDSKSGTIYLKVVNHNGTPQPVKVTLAGVASVAPTATAIVLKSASPDDTNTLGEPTKVVPANQTVSGLGKSFTRDFPAYSITILELKAR